MRPSAWVEPIGKWGRGSVRLVEISTPAKRMTTSSRFGCRKNCRRLVSPSNSSIGCTGSSIRVICLLDTSSHASRPDQDARAGFERFFIDFDGARADGFAGRSFDESVVTVGAGAKLSPFVVRKSRSTAPGVWLLPSSPMERKAGRIALLPARHQKKCSRRRGRICGSPDRDSSPRLP